MNGKGFKSGFKFLSSIFRFRGAFIGITLALLLSMLTLPALAKVTIQQPPTPEPKAVVTILVDEAYVNQIVDDALKDQTGITNPVVDLQAPNQALVTLSVKLASGITIRPTVTLSFSVVNNKVDIQIKNINMQGIMVPQWIVAPPLEGLVQKMEQEINQVVASTENATGLVLTGVSSTNSELVIALGEEPVQPFSATQTPAQQNLVPTTPMSSIPSAIPPTQQP